MLSRMLFFLTSLVVLLIVGFCLPVAAQARTTVVITAPASVEAGRDSDGFAEGSFGLYAHAGAGNVATAATYLGFEGADVDEVFNGMPNLQEYFNDEFFTGTLELLFRADTDGNAATTNDIAPARAPHDVVISEIMWALDDAEDQDSLHLKQWIELVNTTTDGNPATPEVDPIFFTGAASGRWVLHFTPNLHYVPRTTVPSSELSFVHVDTSVDVGTLHLGTYQVIDRVSTIYLSKWLMAGQNGRTRAGEQEGRFQTADIVPLISAYRNINVGGNWGQRGNGADPNVYGKHAVPNGILPGAWKASDTRRYLQNAFLGTPKSLYIGPTVGVTAAQKTSVPSDSVVINEVRNDTSDANLDWIELYNAGTDAVDLSGWELSYVHAAPDPLGVNRDTDIMLVGREAHEGSDADRFAANFRLQPGGYLLIVNRDPRDTPLAGGINVEARNAGEDVNKGATHQYIVRPRIGNMPTSNFMLILRNSVAKNWSHREPRVEADFHLASESIMDYAGNYSRPDYTVRSLTRIPHFNTRVWPFRGWDVPDDQGSIPRSTRQVWARADGGRNLTGGVGYDRGVDLANAPGTPGYANDLIKDRIIDGTGASSFSGQISISEIMYDAGPRWNLIQWIEIYNSSKTDAVNLSGWELEILNVTDDVESYVDSSFVFKDAIVLPNQTLLIVSGTGTNDVAPNRVYNLYEHHRRELGLSNRRSVLLSPEGFYLHLTHKDPTQPNSPRAMITVDGAGNIRLDGARREVAWKLPPRDPGQRQSLVRQYGQREIYLDGIGDSPDDGYVKEFWRQSDIIGASISFYGHRDDIGTPGYRLGSPLPVSLSSFHPARDKTTGEVVIRWITESELNNAGFNILRSESKDGEFQVVNLKGIIAGHGTTSEKHTYQWTDTTAKPNVVYDYRIEDVSLDGNRTTLATTHLRGNVTVAGKATTTWGNLKSQR